MWNLLLEQDYFAHLNDNWGRGFRRFSRTDEKKSGFVAKTHDTDLHNVSL